MMAVLWGVLFCTAVGMLSIGAGMGPGWVLAEVAVIAAAELMFAWVLTRPAARDGVK